MYYSLTGSFNYSESSMERSLPRRVALIMFTILASMINLSCNLIEDAFKATMSPHDVCLELFTEGEVTWWSNNDGSFVVMMPGDGKDGIFGGVYIKEGVITLAPIFSPNDADDKAVFSFERFPPRFLDGQPRGTLGNFIVHSVKDGGIEEVSLTAIDDRTYETVYAYNNVKLQKVNIDKKDFSGEVYAHRGFKGTFDERSFELKGVTADGASQLAFYYKNDDYPNAHFTPYVNGYSSEFGLINDLGHFSQPEYLPELEMWRFYYTVPYYYSQFKELNVTLKANVKEGHEVSFITYDFPILALWKPGVALVHGLNADFLSCWGDFGSYLTSNGNYMSDQVRYIDYETSNKASFHVNTYENRVIEKGLEALYTQMLSGRKVLSSKYTLIGHSMGGILSRLYAQEISADAVGAIITVNTPHWGSRVADIAKGTMTTIEILKDKVQPTNKVGLVTRVALEALVAMYNSDTFGALEDLSSFSDGIAWLNGPKMSELEGIPVHACCSDMTGFVNNPADPVNDIIRIDTGNILANSTPLSLFFTTIPKDKYDDLFVKDVNAGESMEFIMDAIQGEEQHDGVVSFSSQKGGLAEPYMTLSTAPYKGMEFGVVGFGSDAFHCNVTKWDVVQGQLENLLNEPYGKSEMFCYDGFKAPAGIFTKSDDVVSDGGMEFTITENETTSVSIDEHYESEEDDIRVLDIVTSRSEDVIANMAVITYTHEGETQYSIGACSSHFRFEIPEEFSGEVDVYIYGKTENNELTAASEKITL